MAAAGPTSDFNGLSAPAYERMRLPHQNSPQASASFNGSETTAALAAVPAPSLSNRRIGKLIVPRGQYIGLKAPYLKTVFCDSSQTSRHPFLQIEENLENRDLDMCRSPRRLEA